MCHIHPIYAFFYWDCTPVQNFRAIGPLFMEILHFEDLGDTSVVSECSLGVNLVIDNFFYVTSDSSPLYKIWKQSDHYLWRYRSLKIWGIWVSFGCERSCSSHRRVSNFNSKVPQGGIYPHIKFERDPLNTFRLRVLTSSGSTGGGRGGGGGGAAKTIISPNTSFGDIITSIDYSINSIDYSSYCIYISNGVLVELFMFCFIW